MVDGGGHERGGNEMHGAYATVRVSRVSESFVISSARFHVTGRHLLPSLFSRRL